MMTAGFVRFVAIGVVAVAVGQPARASAQSDRFARAIVDFRAAAQGLYGDEGPQLTGLLDEMRRSLSIWNSAALRDEASRRQELQRASGEEAARLSAQLGLLYLQRHRFADALDAFDAGVDLTPGDRTVHLFRGLVLEQLDRHEEASRAFGRAFANDESDPLAAYLMIATALPESKIDRALQTLERLEHDVTRGATVAARFPSAAVFASDVGNRPVFVPHRYAEAFARHSRGEHEAGLDRLRDAAARDPLLVDPAAGNEELRSASSALRRRNVGAALSALEHLRVRFPDSSETYRLLSIVCSLRGDLARGVEHAETALRLRPDDERAWIALARVQARRGDDAETLRTLERATQALPESGELQWMLASVTHRMERTDEALAAYEAAARAVGIAGRDDLLRSVAYLAHRHQELLPAIEATRARVRISRNDPVAHRELAVLYTNAGRHPQAFAELVVAAWLDRQDPRTFAALGRAFMALGRHERAVDVLQRAVALGPTLPESHYALAQALVRVGRRTDSGKHLAEFHRLTAIIQDAEREVLRFATLLRAARVLADDGHYELAAVEYAKVVALHPSLQNNLEAAQVLEQAGRLEESLERLIAAATLGGAPEVHLRVAAILSRLGRTDESEKARQRYESLRLEELEPRSSVASRSTPSAPSR